MRRFLVSMVLLMATALPAPAGAAPGWLPSGDVASSSSQALDDNAVVTDAAGNVTAVWNNGTTAPGLIASTRSAITHAWSTPVTISEAGTFAEDATVAVDAAGNVTALWERKLTDAKARVQSAVRDAATGAWSEPRYVDDSTSFTGIRDTDLAVAPDGTVHAVWITGYKSGPAHVWMSKRPTLSSGWDAPFEIEDTPATPSIDGSQIAVAPNGRAFAVWTALVSGVDRVQRAFVRDTGEWSTAANLAGSESAENVRVAALPNGQFVAAWANVGDNSQNPGTAWVKAVVDGPAFSAAPVDLGRTATATRATNLFVASDASGNATVTWTRNDDGRHVIAAAWNGSSWQIQAVSPDGSAGMPTDLAYDAAGNAHIAWVRVNSDIPGTPGRVFVSTRSVGGVFGTPADLSLGEADGRQARLAFDGAGNGIAVWNYPGASSYRIKAAGFDGAPPALTGAGSTSVPATGTVGQPVAMSAAPSNPWGDAAIYWTFGDGATGSGGSISHTYAVPGTYTVITSAVDQVGSGSTTRTITISAAPIPGGPGGAGGPGTTTKPTPEALLSGKKITLAAVLGRSKKAKKCPKSATASVNTRSKGKTYKGSAKLKVKTVTVDGKSRCKTTGTLKLNRTPPKSLKSLTVKVGGPSLTARTIRTVRDNG